MRRVLTDNKQMAAAKAGSQEHGVRQIFVQLTLVILMLIAAPQGQAVIGAEPTSPASEQDAKAVDAVASPESGKAETEAAQVKGPDPKWQPPPMPEPAPYATVDLTPEEVKELADKWGVELLGMRLTTAGYMLDFRFRVMDADKALPLFDHRIKPHIVAERSNIKLPVPMSTKVGAFRPTNRGKNIKADKTYYMIFGNPDRHVKVGEKVTVVIGDFKVEHLMVN